MMKNKLFVFIICCLFAGPHLFAQKLRTGIGISAVTPIGERIGYSVNSKANPGFGLAIKEEFNFHRNFGIILGLEYQNWGVEFDGIYYDYPDHLGNVGFDKYHHKIRVNELLVPLMIKIDGDSLFGNKSLYLVGGYAFRYVFSSQTEITFNATNELLYKGGADFQYYGWFIEEHTIVGGVGMDFGLSGTRSIFYTELNYYHSQRYFLYSGKKEDFSSNDLGIVISSLALTLGLYL